MQELRSADDGAGYWQGSPLSPGRVVEDALALAWRLRMLLAPIILLQMITMGLTNVLIGPTEPVPADIPGRTTAVHDFSPFDHQISSHSLIGLAILYCLNVLFAVAMTKIMYTAYHDHIDLPASKASGFTLGTLRAIAAQIGCVFLIGFGFILVMIVPAVTLGTIVLVLSLTLGNMAPISLLADTIAIVTLCVLSGLYVLIANIGAQYITVGSMLRTDNLSRLFRECSNFVFARAEFNRLLKLSAISFGLVVALMIVITLVQHLIVLSSNATLSLIIAGALQALVLTPLMTAFGVVFYVDAHQRLLHEQALP